MKQKINDAKHIVVFSGAGFSTESNIPDFRSANGIYQKKTYPYPCETMISHHFYHSNTREFYEFYRNEMVYQNALPNKGHYAIAKLEQLGKLEAVITQNIDGLHQKAGNTKVLELHGSIHRNYCTKCNQFYELDVIMETNDIPYCKKCGAFIKPDVVLYEEMLDEDVLNKSIMALHKADLLIVAGTSLTVYPAAGLLHYYRGDCIILINHEETYADSMATIISRENIGEVLDFINKEL